MEDFMQAFPAGVSQGHFRGGQHVAGVDGAVGIDGYVFPQAAVGFG